MSSFSCIGIGFYTFCTTFVGFVCFFYEFLNSSLDTQITEFPDALPEEAEITGSFSGSRPGSSESDWDEESDYREIKSSNEGGSLWSSWSDCI